MDRLGGHVWEGLGEVWGTFWGGFGQAFRTFGGGFADMFARFGERVWDMFGTCLGMFLEDYFCLFIVYHFLRFLFFPAEGFQWAVKGYIRVYRPFKGLYRKL